MNKNRTFDLQAFLPYCLNQAAEAASAEFQRYYQERYHMTRPQWRVLVHLGQFGDMTASAIARKSGLDKTKVSRAVFDLEQRGWLVRQRDARDRRVEHLNLTEPGQEVFRDLGKIAVEHDATILADITAEEATVLRTVLRKLTHGDTEGESA